MIHLLLLAGLAGCKGDDASKGETGETGETGPSGPVQAADRPNGDYLLGFSIAAVGGLTIPFQASVRSLEDETGQILSSFTLRATDGADLVSEDLASTGELPYDENGGVTVDLGTFVLPGEFSPTGGEVELAVALDVTSSDAEGFCGDVTGQIVTFGLDLAGSTFGATPWETRVDGADVSCGASSEDLPRLDAADCPALVAGTNSGFGSGGLTRSFELVLPASYDAATSWPLVFVFHGYGGAGQGMLDTGLSALADELGVILVAPDAADRGGEAAWDVFNDEATNTDLVLFDDLLTCASNSFNVDSDRVYATGMSNGGLFTGLLLARHSDVLAAAAPLSGGLFGEMSDSFQPMPVQVLWGGPTDEAYEVDFDAAAQELIDLLLASGSFVVACEHDAGHELDSSFWDFTIPFLLDHTLGEEAEPYAEGLPETYPDWCWIAE